MAKTKAVVYNCDAHELEAASTDLPSPIVRLHDIDEGVRAAVVKKDLHKLEHKRVITEEHREDNTPTKCNDRTNRDRNDDGRRTTAYPVARDDTDTEADEDDPYSDDDGYDYPDELDDDSSPEQANYGNTDVTDADDAFDDIDVIPNDVFAGSTQVIGCSSPYG